MNETGPGATNSVGYMPLSHARGDPWAAYDRLPRAVQRFLQGSVVDLCALVLEVRYRDVIRFGPAEEMSKLVLEAFETAEMIEVSRFSELQFRTRGRQSAHVAADATIVRPSSRRERSLPRATNGS